MQKNNMQTNNTLSATTRSLTLTLALTLAAVFLACQARADDCSDSDMKLVCTAKSNHGHELVLQSADLKSGVILTKGTSCGPNTWYSIGTMKVAESLTEQSSVSIELLNDKISLKLFGLGAAQIATFVTYSSVETRVGSVSNSDVTVECHIVDHGAN
jgi:hypothetical protein